MLGSIILSRTILRLRAHTILHPSMVRIKSEFLVPVKRLFDCDETEVADEAGLHGNRNSIAQPSAPRWKHTVSRLKQVWRIDC